MSFEGSVEHLFFPSAVYSLFSISEFVNKFIKNTGTMPGFSSFSANTDYSALCIYLFSICLHTRQRIVSIS